MSRRADGANDRPEDGAAAVEGVTAIQISSFPNLWVPRLQVPHCLVPAALVHLGALCCDDEPAAAADRPTGERAR